MSWDQTQFNEVLKEYLGWTKRTLAEVLNTKAYYIARKAIWYTAKASKESIGDSLGRFVSTSRTTKSGKTTTSRRLELAEAREADAPLAALIVNARRGAEGRPGLYGQAMAAAVRQLIAARVRSIAFIKSGWLPAIRILQTFAKDKSGAGPTDSAARIYGQEKGAAYPAVEGHEMISRIVNSAAGKAGTSAAALDKYGGKGLDMAFYDETASMKEYIERKMAEDADRANASL